MRFTEIIFPCVFFLLLGSKPASSHVISKASYFSAPILWANNEQVWANFCKSTIDFVSKITDRERRAKAGAMMSEIMKSRRENETIDLKSTLSRPSPASTLQDSHQVQTGAVSPDLESKCRELERKLQRTRLECRYRVTNPDRNCAEEPALHNHSSHDDSTTKYEHFWRFTGNSMLFIRQNFKEG